MTASKTDSGGDFLAKKSDLLKSRGDIPQLVEILIVEDETQDAERLNATLHLLFGYDVQIRKAATLNSAMDAVIERTPEIVFLDDVLRPSDNATQSIPFLRRAGFEGPIVVISGQVTRQRRKLLMDAGAAEVIHKDQVDSVRITEALTKVYSNTQKDGDA